MSKKNRKIKNHKKNQSPTQKRQPQMALSPQEQETIYQMRVDLFRMKEIVEVFLPKFMNESKVKEIPYENALEDHLETNFDLKSDVVITKYGEQV